MNWRERLACVARHGGLEGAGLLLAHRDGSGSVAVLLGYRRWTGRSWSLPAGGVRRGEGSFACALRETREEFGPFPNSVAEAVDRHCGGRPEPPSHAFRLPTGYRFTTFLVPLEERPLFEAWPLRRYYRTEFSKVGWFPLDDLPDGLHVGLAQTFEALRVAEVGAPAARGAAPAG
jgi:8-oxo-dGTP pyrophosphatase MutT (NUDIX family)